MNFLFTKGSGAANGPGIRPVNSPTGRLGIARRLVLWGVLFPVLSGPLFAFSRPAFRSSPAAPVDSPQAPPSPARSDVATAVPFMDEATFRQHYWPFAGPDTVRPPFVLVVGGDYRGKLSPCGCPHLRMGGLPWRMDFIERLRMTSGVPVIQLDTGGTLVPPDLPPHLSVVYLEYMLSALGRAGWTAINITPGEALVLDTLWRLSPASGDGPAIWRDWLPHTFHRIGNPPAALAGLWDIRQMPPPPPADFASSPRLPTLLSANLRHPRLSSHEVLHSADGDYLVTGLSLFADDTGTPRLPAPWKVYSPEEGWARFIREVLPSLERSHRLRGVVILLSGDATAAGRLTTRVTADLASRATSSSPRLAHLVFHGSGSDSHPSRASLPTEPSFIPVGVEGRFLALGYPLPSGFQIRPTPVTARFRSPGLRSDPAGTVWDRVMELAFHLQSHLTLQFLENSPSSGTPSGKGTGNEKTGGRKPGSQEITAPRSVRGRLTSPRPPMSPSPFPPRHPLTP